MERVKMESIYKYICRNIQENGKLKEDFNLDRYDKNNKSGIRFALGMIDGINLYHATIETDEELKSYITEKLKEVNRENIETTEEEIENYLKISEKRMLGNIDDILRWILNNSTIDFDSIARMAICLIIETTNIEALKMAIGIIGLIDLSDRKELIDILTKIALCDEFTLYSINALTNLENANDISFMLIKKVDGWGKIHLLDAIKVKEDTIREWLIINGCKNDIHLGYTASTVANKVILSEVLSRETLSKEEFSGVSNILEGIFKDGPVTAANQNDKCIRWIKGYMNHFKKFIFDLDFYCIPILFTNYLYSNKRENDEDIKIVKDIENLMRSKEVIGTLKESIKDGKKLAKVLEVIDFNTSINLYDEIYEKYKENPFEYYNCLKYLLKNEDCKEEAIELLSNSVNLKEYYKKPKNVFGMNHKISNQITFIIQILKEYPFLGNDFIVAGLKSENMQPRNAALNTIQFWMKMTQKDFKDFPKEIYEAVVELQKDEIIKNYKIRINELLGITEDLSNYEEPITIWNEPIEEDLDLDLWDEKLEDLFEVQIKTRGTNYYNKKMVYSCNESTDKYMAFVQGSEFGKEYEVIIEKNKKGRIKSMTCNCPYGNHCKHEYATILHLRNMEK